MTILTGSMSVTCTIGSFSRKSRVRTSPVPRQPANIAATMMAQPRTRNDDGFTGASLSKLGHSSGHSLPKLGLGDN